MVRKIKIFFGLVLSFGLFSFSAHSMSVLQVNIEQLSQYAAKVVFGKILTVDPHAGTNGNPAYMAVRVQVIETFKGVHESVYEFHQPTSLSPQKRGMFSDLPKYAPGETVVLFLTQPSDIQLSTPIGLSQGIFKVQGKEGVADPQLINGTKNKTLFQNLRSAKTKSALRNLKMVETSPSLKLSQLRELVRQVQGTP